MKTLEQLLEHHIEGGIGAYGKLMDDLVEWNKEYTCIKCKKFQKRIKELEKQVEGAYSKGIHDTLRSL